MPRENFRFFMPVDIFKATDKNGSEVMKISGIASTSSRDSQGETLDVKNFDLTNFSQINWNHKGKDDPAAHIGEPTMTKIVDGNKLYIEGVLYPDVPMAKAVYTLMKALKKSPSGKKLGLSVEGKVIERESNDEKSPLYKNIKKARITGVAVCPHPINGDTIVDLMEKGYTKDDIDLLYDDSLEKAISLIEDDILTSTNLENKKNEKSFEKSVLVEKIYNYFGDINQESLKSVIDIVEKISKMSKTPITEETLRKAMEILNIASSENKEKELQESVDADIMKSFVDNFDTKFSAMAELFEYQNEQINSLKEESFKKSEEISSLVESNNSLVEKINEVLSVRVPGKSITKAEAVEKFAKENGVEVKDVQTFSISTQKRSLVSTICDKAGLSKGVNDPSFDKELIKIAQDIELAGVSAIDTKAIERLSKINIQVVR